MKTKKPQEPEITLLHRDAYDKDLDGLSFDEYLQKRNRDPIVERIREKAYESSEELALNDKIDHLLETVNDPSTKQKEILDLWNTCFQMLDAPIGGLSSFLDIYLHPLMSITAGAKFSYEQMKNLDDTLINGVEKYLDHLFMNDSDTIPFIKKVNLVIQWHILHNKFLVGVGLTNRVGTFKYLQSLLENNIADFEALKAISPITFINYVEVLKAMYKSSNKDYKVQLKGYYRKKCLEVIIVARNAGLYDGYDQLLRDYYTIKLEDRPKLNWCFDKLIGYGERPWKLVWLFLGTNALFALAFSVLPFKFHLPSHDANWCWLEQFFTYVMFNNTTMLTVGYGDMYPEGIGAKIVVALLQIVGFAISGTAIALFLRRLLRF